MSFTSVRTYPPAIFNSATPGLLRWIAQAGRRFLHRAFPLDRLFRMRSLLGRGPKPDGHFPHLITLEIDSRCNLHCIHCPSHSGKTSPHRVYGSMDIKLFFRLMDEIDGHGPRDISLHKDGEPLLHPEIGAILARLKKNCDHRVYLSTNGLHLTEEISRSILDARIDTLNFSLGAVTQDLYKKIRGGDLARVEKNIAKMVSLREKHPWKPKWIAQIIDLPSIPELKKEIPAFVKHWTRLGAEAQVWEELTWGMVPDPVHKIKRYPCFSLWDTLDVNSNGTVSACCMDWKGELLIGDAKQERLEDIWKGPALADLRKWHIGRKISRSSLCQNCNYWRWMPKLKTYHNFKMGR